MALVDLRAKPYYLSEEDITWVEDTIKGMTLEEKIGQLFINLFLSLDTSKIKEFVSKYPIGGARYLGGSSEKVYEFISDLQRSSKIPVLVACNCDSGGDGAVSDGTYIASAAQCEASGNEKLAYNAGYVSGREATAIGCNWNFDPCADILYNWRNTIVNTRAYGTNPDSVIKYTSAYIKGLRQSNIASCAKHFPGDGTEERDQHLVLGVNELSVEEWDKSFGKVYKHLIDEGLMTIMAGHIALPEYQYKLNPNLKYEDILPATLSPELITGLLKEKLGFNGLVTTDASHMIGMAAAMKRKDYVPAAIAAGCDMFLFFNDPEEDFNFMLEGYKNGVITDERLHDALRRVLGLKASLKLHVKQKEGTLIAPKEGLVVIGCKEHLYMAAEAADLGISLVKDTWSQLPIKPSTHKRIRLHTLFGEIGGLTHGSNDAKKIIIEELERAGFEVALNDGNSRDKGKTAELSQNFDAALVFADIVGYAAENNYRIRWKCPMSTDIPWYIHEIPTVFVSLNFTTHLTDVPMMKTYINAYKDTREVIRQTIQKIMGESEFKGTEFNDNVWCDKWETRR
ncbi:glycoside hydrolase family 3 protein [Clostridium folliculivorans]|uniref:beta-N-acetylhexosaminidase n=1 Tax=Clostridium folliculivorans TaxID=2886038 RepID=A0A9W6DCC2_9CLOT|nr:glycoside hydrolase family 3 N-terminal domain-containing protein [Clostridium folliculivorans]GKU26598.1 glycosyl hydrolase [Clostridium folliculivorans]GKU28970.1 glycosyl hydrolase [Clostridium folliculivorans]